MNKNGDGLLSRLPGTAEVRVSAASTAVYLNECARLGLPFRVLEREDECTLRLRLRQSDARRAEEAAKRCGMQAHIAKPIEVDLLMRTLAEILSESEEHS